MGLKDIFRAIREYPTVCSELKQAQQALEQSEQKCRSLELKLEERLYQPFEKQFKVSAMDGETTELKFYCPLSGELAGQMLDGSDLLKFQDTILQRIEGEQLPKKTERGLMADFDGLDYVDDKVFSMFPSVEEVDGQLYGVAVCQIKGKLSPGELEHLKEFCVEQFSYGWGEDFVQHLHRTDYGDLYVSFWQDSSATILTKEELEAARAPSRPFRQLRENRGEHDGR